MEKDENIPSFQKSTLEQRYDKDGEEPVVFCIYDGNLQLNADSKH